MLKLVMSAVFLLSSLSNCSFAAEERLNIVEVGSGSWEEYYYNDDADYFSDNEGSGEDSEEDLSINVELETKKASEFEKNSGGEDFHFEHNTISSNDLYQYYNHLHELEKKEENDKQGNPEISKYPQAEEGFNLNCVYVMIASACLTFCLVILGILICSRKYLFWREKKSPMMPFVISKDQRVTKEYDKYLSTPIVKSYQKVPVSTKEFLHSDFTNSDKPLLS